MVTNVWFVRKVKSLFNGSYNGYVVIHKSHPWYGLNYNDIPVSIHGGLTFGKSADLLDWEELKDYNCDWWVYGFDTQHLGDTPNKWPKEKVEEETGRLAEQFWFEHIKKIRNDIRSIQS